MNENARAAHAHADATPLDPPAPWPAALRLVAAPPAGHAHTGGTTTTATTTPAPVGTAEPSRAPGTSTEASHARDVGRGADTGVEVSVVMPCLNEEGSVGTCVRKALEGLAASGLTGEVVVVDNGSTDASVARAEAAGARVVHEQRRGYGNAYRAGFAAARGRHILMGDSDDSYDFSRLPDLVAPLLAGRADYVLGSRFAGDILPGAMPWLHRYVGNPVLTAILNRLFEVRSSDAHSGMRAFTRDAYLRMGLRCEGMELASEIVIAAARAGLRIEEVPITYHPRVGSSKLHSLRDGWRHLRFMLLLAPRHLFVLPGLALLLAGSVGQLALLPGSLDLGFHALDTHFSVLFALLAILGWQVVLLGVFADAYNRATGWSERRRWPLTTVHRYFSLERGIVGGAALFAVGFVIDVVILIRWLANALGPLDEIRPALLALTLMVLGAQTAFGSFLLRLLTAGPSGDSRRGQRPGGASAGPRSLETASSQSCVPSERNNHGSVARPGGPRGTREIPTRSEGSAGSTGSPSDASDLTGVREARTPGSPSGR